MFNQKKNYFIKNLIQVYSIFLNQSITEFDYFIEENLYLELDDFKNKKIFPRTHLVKVNNSLAVYKINKNLFVNKQIYIEEIILVLQTFVLTSKNYQKSDFLNSFNINAYIEDIYNCYEERVIEAMPFVTIEIKGILYYGYSKEIEFYLNNISLDDLKNLEILLKGDPYYIEIFFKNFSYFKPKQLNNTI